MMVSAESMTMGIDLGASLTKISILSGSGAREFRILPTTSGEELLQLLDELQPGRIGLTGAGAPELAQRLGGQPVAVNEFAAWGRGARRLLREREIAQEGPFALVSLGTGTSVMSCDGMAVNRLGGTALGGGTVLGLGALLVGESDFDALAELAAKGDRRKVDLLVGDIYRPGEIPLIADATASNFGKRQIRTNSAAPEDLAQAIMGLVAENVALLCNALASAHQLHRIVYGGTALRHNPTLRAILMGTSAAFGKEPVHLEDGEYAGALGAMAFAADGEV